MLEAPQPQTEDSREPIGFAIEAVTETTETAIATVSAAAS